jgi:hypothetical protein
MKNDRLTVSMGEDPVIELPEGEHPAVVTLTQLSQSDQITPDIFNSLLFKFQKLHQSCA